MCELNVERRSSTHVGIVVDRIPRDGNVLGWIMFVGAWVAATVCVSEFVSYWCLSDIGGSRMSVWLFSIGFNNL